MEKIYYNKLARDKIPEIIHDKGFDCEIRTVSDEEYKREIVRKVYEEASGVTNHDDRKHMVEEIADLIITLEAVKKEFEISSEEIDAAVKLSIDEKGGYDKKLYLAWSSDTEYSTNERTHGFDD